MTAPLPQAPCWLTVEQAARYIHRRKADVEVAVASGELAAWCPQDSERGTVVHTDDLDAFVRHTYRPAMTRSAAIRALAGARS